MTKKALIMLCITANIRFFVSSRKFLYVYFVTDYLYSNIFCNFTALKIKAMTKYKA